MLKTQLAHGIDITETKSKYDTRAKYLVSNKQVHGVLPQNEKIEGMDTTSKIPGEGEVTFDIRFNALTPQMEKVKLIINIESQKDYRPGYHFCSRGIFYCSRMISEQVYTEFVPDNYDDIKKVYSIWLCMEPPMKYANTITEYSMEEKNIYGEFTGVENYDLLSVVVIRLCTDDDIQALLLVLYNLWEGKQAANESEFALQTIEKHLEDPVCEEEGIKELPICEIDGIQYIGILGIPKLGLQLPIIYEWSHF